MNPIRYITDFLAGLIADALMPPPAASPSIDREVVQIEQAQAAAASPPSEAYRWKVKYLRERWKAERKQRAIDQVRARLKVPPHKPLLKWLRTHEIGDRRDLLRYMPEMRRLQATNDRLHGEVAALRSGDALKKMDERRATVQRLLVDARAQIARLEAQLVGAGNLPVAEHAISQPAHELDLAAFVLALTHGPRWATFDAPTRSQMIGAMRAQLRVAGSLCDGLAPVTGLKCILPPAHEGAHVDCYGARA